MLTASHFKLAYVFFLPQGFPMMQWEWLGSSARATQRLEEDTALQGNPQPMKMVTGG